MKLLMSDVKVTSATELTVPRRQCTLLLLLLHTGKQNLKKKWFQGFKKHITTYAEYY